MHVREVRRRRSTQARESVATADDQRVEQLDLRGQLRLSGGVMREAWGG